jgi:FkbM family methyltransferase
MRVPRLLVGELRVAQGSRLSDTVQMGQTVYDIGANVGYYSVLGSRLVGSTGRVYAFEPLPRNLVHLRRHLVLNCAHNATVIEAAVAGRTGPLRFKQQSAHEEGHLSPDGDLGVWCVAIDEVIATPRSDGRLSRVASGSILRQRL